MHDDLATLGLETLTYQDASVPLPGMKIQNSHGDVLRVLVMPEHQAAALLSLITQILDSPWVTASEAAKRDLPHIRTRLEQIQIDPKLLETQGESIIQALPSLDLFD